MEQGREDILIKSFIYFCKILEINLDEMQVFGTAHIFYIHGVQDFQSLLSSTLKPKCFAEEIKLSNLEWHMSTWSQVHLIEGLALKLDPALIGIQRAARQNWPHVI